VLPLGNSLLSRVLAALTRGLALVRVSQTPHSFLPQRVELRLHLLDGLVGKPLEPNEEIPGLSR
jgi:hypothetical protein